MATNGEKTISRAESLDVPKPLCVDLDGTLIETDMLIESFLQLLRHNLRDALSSLFFLFQGKAAFKSRLARKADFEPDKLPYNRELFAYLTKQHKEGRDLLLVTASDQLVADRIASHLGIFSGVMASREGRNLKGRNKARALVERFGEGGFSYAGDALSDLPVWQASKTAILVNVSSSTARCVSNATAIEASFHTKPNVLLSLLQAFRVHQWVKNLLVFIPMIAAHAIVESQAVLASITVFFALCLAASGTYVINDLLDLEADRRHPRKRMRPFASGKLALHFGALGPLMLVAGVLVALSVSLSTALIVMLYLLITNAYSLYLKKKPLVDVFALAMLYFLRVFAGGVATGINVSVWLLSFSGFLFLALAILKRVAELEMSEATSAGQSRRGYLVEDAAIMQSMGIASSFVSSLVLALYVSSDIAKITYALPDLLWGVVPLFLFWQCQLWLATSRGLMHDDPIIYTSKDWVSWVTFGLIAVIFFLSIIGIPVP